jgi:hypothetical protein
MQQEILGLKLILAEILDKKCLTTLVNAIYRKTSSFMAYFVLNFLFIRLTFLMEDKLSYVESYGATQVPYYQL